LGTHRIENHVDAPRRTGHLVDVVVHFDLVERIDLSHGRSPAAARDHIRDVLNRRFRTPGEEDVRTPRGQLAGHRAADRAPCSEDDSRLARQASRPFGCRCQHRGPVHGCCLKI
jgi:hypothetical protein